MQQHGVPGSLHRRQAGRRGSSCQHDPAVGVEQRQRHAGQEDAVEHAVLVVDGRVAEQEAVVTKHRGLEETRGLLDDGDEEVRGRRRGGEDEDGADEEEGAADGAHLAVVQREADGDEALQSHAGQDERGGAGGEDRRHHLRMEHICSSVRKYEQRKKKL